MAVNFPTSLDSFTNPTATSKRDTPSLAGQQTDQNTAIIALETKIGINSSAVVTTIDYLLKNSASSNPGHKHTLAQGATDVTALFSDLNKLASLATTAAELGYVSGVTSAIQTQLNGKQATLTLPLTVANGGSGAATLTGVLIGNGTSAFTTVTAPAGTILGTTDTQTLTNKRITKRIVSTASSATPTPNGDTTDVYEVTAQAAGATFGAPTGTPTDGQTLVIRIKDNGGAQTLAFNAIYRFSSDLPAPTTTVLSKTFYLGFMYNSADSKWDCLALLNNF